MSSKLQFDGKGTGTKKDPFVLSFNNGTDGIHRGVFVLDSNHGQPKDELFSLGFSTDIEGVSVGLLERKLNASGTQLTIDVEFKALNWFPDKPNKVFVKAIKFENNDGGILQKSYTLLDEEHTVEDGWSGNEYWFITEGNPLEVPPGPCKAVVVVDDVPDTIERYKKFLVTARIETENNSGEFFINYTTSSRINVVWVGNPAEYTLEINPFALGEQSLTFSGFARWMVKDTTAGTPFTDVKVEPVVLDFNVVESIIESEVPTGEGPSPISITENIDLVIADKIINPDVVELQKQVTTLTERIERLETLLDAK